jgi:hypothetical protein
MDFKDVDQEDEMKIGDPLAWSSDLPKEWPLSVQSSSTTTSLDRSSTREQGYLQATPEEGWYTSLWIDTHLLEMKIKTNYGFKRWPSVKSKDDPVPSQDQGVSGWTQRLRLPTKVSFKGGSHLGNPNPSFFLASPISGTRFLLRVVVCNIPIFYQILEWILFLFCFVCINWIFIGI